jgi:hypothetical protein
VAWAIRKALHFYRFDPEKRRKFPRCMVSLTVDLSSSTVQFMDNTKV